MRAGSLIRLRVAQLRNDGERGLLSLVMIIVIVGMGVGALMVPMIVTQSRSTLHTDTRVQSLNVAQSGVDAMLGRIRPTLGLTANLRCYDGSANYPALTNVLAGSNAPSYAVTVQYFTSDPRVAIPSSTDPTLRLPTAMSCSVGGTSSANGNVPSFARIASTGTASGGGSTSTRTLYTTYAFTTSNTTTNGGQIRVYTSPASDPPMCMSSAPAPDVGTPLSLQLCSQIDGSAAYPAQTLFSYSADLSLRLVSSVTATRPYGLCVDSAIPHTNANPVTLQPCLAPGATAYNQQWRLNAGGQFTGTRADLTPDTFCLAATDPRAAQPVLLNTCLAGSSSYTKDSWVPTPSVGSGAAGAADSQLVNFSQFGRCADVTTQTVLSLPVAFMILYPCVQDPRPAQVDWSQKFTYNSVTKQWVTTTNSTAYCLADTGVAGGYVTVVLCNIGDRMQQWTEFGVTQADQANASQWTYDQRYTIVDASGRCLSLSPISGPNPDWFVPANTYRQYSKLTADTCDGSTRQKWNADPYTQSSSLQNTHEK